MSDNENVHVALVDDHKLFRKGIAGIIGGFSGYSVAYDCSSGLELIEQIRPSLIPQIVLLDINMPEMDGYQTALWLKENHPQTKVLALSMYEDEGAIIKMLKSGASGYILKDTEPSELRIALQTVIRKGFYHSEVTMDALVKSIHHQSPVGMTDKEVEISEREIEFLRYASTELTYKEIADKMCLAVRTIDGYREALFTKLNVKSRIGLVLYAIRNQIVSVR